MKRIMLVLFLSIGVAGLGAAHGGGMGGGGPMGSGGAGMLTVADDGSLLATEMSSMMGGGPGGSMGGDDRALVNIDPDGNERWRATFDEGWPMMAVTDGNLVVFTLREDWWSGTGGSGDGGWNHGGGHSGGHGGGGGGGGGGGPHADSSIVVGLDLETGNELWRTVVDGDMISTPQFTPNGSQFYLTVRDFSENSPGLGGGSMHQGDSPGAHQLMSTSVVAIDRDGVVLWSAELAEGGNKIGRTR